MIALTHWLISIATFAIALDTQFDTQFWNETEWVSGEIEYNSTASRVVKEI